MSQLAFNAPSEGSAVKLSGAIDRIIYRNDENGYTVFELVPEGKGEDEVVKVVGNSGEELRAGLSVKLEGSWSRHQVHGMQIRLESLEVSVPSSSEGIRAYLASGLIKGIGKVIANRIVDAFGSETLRIFEEEPQRLLEINGISESKLEKILASWEENRGMKDLVSFLQLHGIGASYAKRIYRRYGAQSLAIVRENPYRLAMDIERIGFLTADALARKLGFGETHPLRAQAGVLYTLMELVKDGNVYYPRQALVKETIDKLKLDPELVELVDQGVDALAREERVVLEDLNGETGVYVSRYHHYESKMAFYLQRILRSPKSVAFSDVEDTVRKAVEGIGLELAEEQRDAVRTAVKSKVMVLTGGPGTGKTTIIKAIIAAFAQKKTRILLAAPTGRAAKRMAEACQREARTIHRLLEYSPVDEGFVRNEDNPLACGLLVVDEASMMDTWLAYSLLKATPLGATVLFVGDVHQLPSVGPGNVLGDFIASGVVPVVELVQVFRQAAQSAIVRNAHLINGGEMPPLDYPPRGRLSDFYFMKQDDPDKVLATIVNLVKNRIPDRFHLKPVKDIQVLSPIRGGNLGVDRLNTVLQEALNPGARAVKRGETSYGLGDKVMQIHNNYDKDVYNGDIGIIVSVDEKEKTLSVRMDDRTVIYGWDELDDLVLAYAATIHKSQGSEYPVVVIPVMMQHYVMLQRNLLYTAVTRGKRLVMLVGQVAALRIAIDNNQMQKRYTRLAHRLRMDIAIS